MGRPNRATHYAWQTALLAWFLCLDIVRILLGATS